MKKRFKVIISLLLSMVCVFPSYAVATTSNASIATLSNISEETETIEYISPITRTVARAVSSVPTITNTIDYNGAYIELAYYDMSNVIHYKRFKVETSGAFAFEKPSDYVKPQYLSIYLMAKSLPSSGNYTVKTTYRSNTGVVFGGTPWVHTSKSYSNASNASATFNLENYIYDSYGDAYTEFSVNMGSGSLTYFQVKMPCSEVSFQANGNISVNFTRLSSSATVDGSTAGSDTYTSEDANKDTATNTAEIATGVADVNDNLKEIIQTISNQLEALWNQMYNYIHLEDMANADKNANNIINNQNQNTNQIVDAMEENTNTTVTAIENHGNFIIEGLKGLFIPSDDFFKTYFDDLSSWFSDRLGFLFFPIDLFLEIIDLFVGISDADFVLTLPPLQVSGYYLWNELSFNFTEFANNHFGFLLEKIRLVTSVYLVFCFVQLCQRKWNEVMMN